MSAILSRLLPWLASLLTGPLLEKAADVWKAKIAAQTDGDKLTADLAVQSIKADLEQRRVNASLGWGPIGCLVFLFGSITALYFGKCVVWDTMLGLGETPAVRGLIADMMTATVYCIVGGGTVGGFGIKALHMAATRLGR